MERSAATKRGPLPAAKALACDVGLPGGGERRRFCRTADTEEEEISSGGPEESKL